MSHTSSITAIKITNIAALQSAVAELQANGVRCSLSAGGTPRAFFPNQAGMGAADYVLKLDGAKYDVGFYKQPDGSYEARTDFWGGSVESCLGAKASKPETADQAKMGRLFQMYGIHAATQEARRRGLSVRRVNGADGLIQLELTGPSL